ncbi:MAG TPA: hypothetical protein PK990_09290 [Salinivirgaceae bacterium]|nr:hypothetical protein [Salinivirgaceae bacterium]
MRKLLFCLAAFSWLTGCKNECPRDARDVKNVKDKTVEATISELQKKYPDETFRIERGVRQAAALWRQSDGDEKEFQNFCNENFIADSAELYTVFLKVSRNLEILLGRFNQITISLLEPLHLDIGPLHAVDHIFGAYNVGAHLWNDMYDNKLAFIVALNFPNYSTSEKNQLGENWSRQQWAYARMGDLFTARVPASLQQSLAEINTKADSYIADYNIFVGNLIDDNGKTYFPADMKLLSHWNLRDEIKSNYADKDNGLTKQRMIYSVMLRIIDQSIPEAVINSNQYQWNPFTNEVWKDGQKQTLKPEPNTRYYYVKAFFDEYRKHDPYYTQSDTYIKRAFDDGMEITQEEVEKLFMEYVSSPLTKQVGELIASRLGRPLEPFDIWYDGFKSRSSMNQQLLDSKTQKLYPNPKRFEQEIPTILMKLGYTPERAKYLAEKIVVDPARGSGHAWGAVMKGDVAHLRTRVGKEGMNYKGYNIAIHELGHNIEQTISLYDMDYYMLQGVPNTAFTEALAFMFQKRDLQILGIETNDVMVQHLNTLDQFWSMYEIMGVSLVDMRVWKWLYQNPNATVDELKNQVISIANDVWNQYYAPVFGKTDQPILAIYSHMISSPLYLSAYPFGLLIDFQLEQYIADKKFSDEVDRIFKLGRLTPDHWMKQAVGQNINLEPIFSATQRSLEALGKK